jgi:hypothetical protein
MVDEQQVVLHWWGMVGGQPVVVPHQWGVVDEQLVMVPHQWGVVDEVFVEVSRMADKHFAAVVAVEVQQQMKAVG